MIIRQIVSRHGRMVLTTPTRQSCLRALTTETAGTTTATLDPPSVARPAMDKEASPSLYVANRPNSFGGKVDSAPDTVAEEFRDRLKIRDRFGDQGSVVEQRYRPGDLLRDPPAPKDVTLELLMASQTHMGHHRSQWNPANARYVYGVRAGIHIISLEQTAAHLRRAARVVEEVAYRGGLLLFVGTRKGQMETVVRAAALAGACHVFTKWNPGAITNHDVLLANSALRIVDEHDQALPGFDEHLRDRRPLRPDLVIVLNPLENFALLHECGLVDIPTIAVLDTDADPTRITYPIPANDDSMRSVGLIAGVLGRAGQMGHARRRRAAKKGNVTWPTETEVAWFMDKQLQTKRSQTAARTGVFEGQRLDAPMNEISG